MPRQRLNRHVRFMGVILDGIATFKMKSTSRPDVEHSTEIDLRTGEVSCSCEHGTYRMQDANIKDPKGLCVHAQRARANIIERAKQINRAGVLA